MTEIKFCTKCGFGLPTRCFHKDKSTKDGYRYWCKWCVSAYRRTYRIKDAKIHRNSRKTVVGYLRTCFQNMKQRCNNPKFTYYKNYGGRGVKVKFTSVGDFVIYVLTELQTDPRGLTIDRIDNNGDYEPGNIRFITQAENNRNR